MQSPSYNWTSGSLWRRIYGAGLLIKSQNSFLVCLYHMHKGPGLHFWAAGLSRGEEGFWGGASGEELPANAGDARDTGSIPGSGLSPGVGNGNPLQKIPWVENPGALQSTGLQRVRHDWAPTLQGLGTCPWGEIRAIFLSFSFFGDSVQSLSIL